MPVSRGGLKKTCQRVLQTDQFVQREANCQRVTLMASAVPAVEKVLQAWGQRLVGRATELRCLTGRKSAAMSASARGGAMKNAHIRAAANELWQGRTQPAQRIEWIAGRKGKGDEFVDKPQKKGAKADGDGGQAPAGKR